MWRPNWLQHLNRKIIYVGSRMEGAPRGVDPILNLAAWGPLEGTGRFSSSPKGGAILGRRILGDGCHAGATAEEPERSHRGAAAGPQRTKEPKRKEPHKSHRGSHRGATGEPQRSHRGATYEPLRSHLENRFFDRPDPRAPFTWAAKGGSN